MAVGARRQARILALKVLYETDLTNHSLDEVLSRLVIDSEEEEEGQEPSPSREAIAYAHDLIEGVRGQQETIDSLIREAAPTWPLGQIARVDKTILRIAIYEVLFNNVAVPPKAAINEAVEIAKSFGSESSAKFINGVLGTVASRKGVA